MSHTRITISFFLLLELSPLVFEFDFLSLLCNTNMLRNILMMLRTNVEQDEMTCCMTRMTTLAGLGGDICFFSNFLLLAVLSVFSPSLQDNTNWHTRIDVSLNKNSV